MKTCDSTLASILRDLPRRAAARLAAALLLTVVCAPVAAQFRLHTSVVRAQPAIAATGPVVQEERRSPPHERRRVPDGVGTLPQPETLPTSVAGAGPLAPGDHLHYVSARIPQRSPTLLGFPAEPSAAFNRDTGLLVANFFAALSIDSGKTWGRILDPVVMFPTRAGGGGFGGDQRVLYIPAKDMMVWYIQYRFSAGLNNGHAKLVYFVGREALRSMTPTGFYDIVPENVGFPAGNWFDFPDLASTTDHLFVSSNVYAGAGGFRGTSVYRFELTDFANGGNTRIEAHAQQDANGLGTMRFTQGAANTMRWAAHRNTASLALFYWVSTGTPQGPDHKAVPQWSTVASNVPGPDGRDWAGYSDHRVLGGYLNLPAQEFGFLWDSAPITNRPEPFVRVAIFRTTDHALLRTEDIWSDTFAFMYPAAAPNDRGHVGFVLAGGRRGATGQHVSSFAGMVDNFNPAFGGGEAVVQLAAGTNGSAVNRWGDYFTVVPHPIQGNTWIGTGMCMRGGVEYQHQESQVVWFGRERDEPAWVALEVHSVGANNVPITLAETDRFGNKDGAANFTRSLAPRQGYKLTAPAVFDGMTFERWSVRFSPTGRFVDQPRGQLTYESADIELETDRAVASYGCGPVGRLGGQPPVLTRPPAPATVFGAAALGNGTTEVAAIQLTFDPSRAQPTWFLSGTVKNPSSAFFQPYSGTVTGAGGAYTVTPTNDYSLVPPAAQDYFAANVSSDLKVMVLDTGGASPPGVYVRDAATGPFRPFGAIGAPVPPTYVDSTPGDTLVSWNGSIGIYEYLFIDGLDIKKTTLSLSATGTVTIGSSATIVASGVQKHSPSPLRQWSGNPTDRGTGRALVYSQNDSSADSYFRSSVVEDAAVALDGRRVFDDANWKANPGHIGGSLYWAYATTSYGIPLQQDIVAMSSVTVPATGGEVTICAWAPPSAQPQIGFVMLGYLQSPGLDLTPIVTRGLLGLQPASLAVLPAQIFDPTLGEMSYSFVAGPLPCGGRIDMQVGCANLVTGELFLGNNAAFLVR